MDKKNGSYLDFYGEYLELQKKSPELDRNYWVNEREDYYARQYEHTIIDGDRQRDLEDFLEDYSKDYKWYQEVKKKCDEIDFKIKKRDHANNPSKFYQDAELILSTLLKPTTKNSYDFLNEALFIINLIKDNGIVLAELQKKIEALSILIINIDQNKWWWTKPHPDDVDTLFKYQKDFLNKKVDQAFDYTKKTLEEIGIDSSLYGLNHDPSAFANAYNKRESTRHRNK